jgi:cytochrome b involved in lipid metabolism
MGCRMDKEGKIVTITEAQMKEHTSDGDLWVMFHGKVYDVSVYMSTHPGGKDILMEFAGGKDASDSYDEADHTKRAKEMITKYYVGDFAA